MKSLLILRHIQVENANAITGMTYGFPGISNFLGFTHALSRVLHRKLNLQLGGCAVVCHKHSVNAHQPSGWGDYVFALTRNPLTKEGKTASFIEEGRMHLDVTLLIECDFLSDEFDFGTGDALQDIQQFESFVRSQALTQRLAGGTINSIGQVLFTDLPEDSESLTKFTHKQRLKLLPGFALVDRSDLLSRHFRNLQEKRPDTQLMDAWLDFAALKFQAVHQAENGEPVDENTKAKWKRVSKPGEGWLVPITTGYRAISSLYEAGQVERTRDGNTPFCFVESVYGVGEWLSPHRVKNFEEMIWRYHADGEWYLCQSAHKPSQHSSDQEDL